jgi:hypothetical protein
VFTGPWSGTQTETAQLTANDFGVSDYLGWSVAVSGNTVVAGAPNHQVGANGEQGAAYVFVMPTTGPWVNATQTAELTASDGQPGDQLGWSVGISGTTVVAGARADSFGTGSSQGAAYAYTEPAGGWATTNAFAAKLTAGDADTADSLGYSVAVSGTTIVGGAPRHDADSDTADPGAAYVFGSGSVVTPPVVPPVVVPPKVTAPTVTVRSILGGHAEITAALSCPAGGASCVAASLKAEVKEHFKGHKLTGLTASITKKKKPSTTTKTVVVASGDVTLAAGAQQTLTLKLNSTGRALLAKFGKLKAIVTVSSGGTTTKTATVTVLKAAKHPKKKKKKK